MALPAELLDWPGGPEVSGRSWPLLGRPAGKSWPREAGIGAGGGAPPGLEEPGFLSWPGSSPVAVHSPGGRGSSPPAGGPTPARHLVIPCVCPQAPTATS